MRKGKQVECRGILIFIKVKHVSDGREGMRGKAQEEGGYKKDTFDTTSKHVNQGIKYMAHQCHEQEWNPNKLGLGRGAGGGGAEVGG